MAGKFGANQLIEMLIAVYFLGALLPSIITGLLGVNTSGWDASTIALWSVVTLIVIAGVVLGIKKSYL